MVFVRKLDGPLFTIQITASDKQHMLTHARLGSFMLPFKYMSPQSSHIFLCFHRHQVFFRSFHLLILVWWIQQHKVLLQFSRWPPLTQQMLPASLALPYCQMMTCYTTIPNFWRSQYRNQCCVRPIWVCQHHAILIVKIYPNQSITQQQGFVITSLRRYVSIISFIHSLIFILDSVQLHESSGHNVPLMFVITQFVCLFVDQSLSQKGSR